MALTTAFAPSQSEVGPNARLMPVRGFTRLKSGLNSLLAGRSPPCTAAATIVNANSPTASGATAIAPSWTAVLSSWVTLPRSGLGSATMPSARR
jgi:hypothetical protein